MPNHPSFMKTDTPEPAPRYERFRLAYPLGYGDPVLLRWRRHAHGLIRAARKEVASFKRADGWRPNVYFDQSSNKALSASVSEYRRILDGYVGLSGSVHRPDVIVRFNGPNAVERTILLEVKKSWDDEYRRGSVYQLFGVSP